MTDNFLPYNWCLCESVFSILLVFRKQKGRNVRSRYSGVKNEKINFSLPPHSIFLRISVFPENVLQKTQEKAFPRPQI